MFHNKKVMAFGSLKKNRIKEPLGPHHLKPYGCNTFHQKNIGTFMGIYLILFPKFVNCGYMLELVL
jgi:hypothetical protein